MLTGICGEKVNWAFGMSDLIRRAYELSHQSPASSGIRELQVFLLPCGLCHLVKDLELDPLNQPSTSIWRTGYYQTDRNYLFLWVADDVEMENGKSSMGGKLCILFSFFFSFSSVVFILRYDIGNT